MEKEEIGGMPPCIRLLAPYLPRDRIRRNRFIGILTICLTFTVHICFAASRKPLTLVQMKVTVECNLSAVSYSNYSYIPNWCSGGWWKNADRSVEHMMGNLLTGFLLIRGVTSYGSGIIADMINPRYFLSAGCFLTGSFAIFLGLAEKWNIASYEYFGTVMANFAIFQSMAWPILLACTNNWYDGFRRGLFYGIWNISNYVGSLLGALVTFVFIDDRWGWCFFVPAIVLFAVGLVCWLLLVVHPSDLKALDNEKKKDQYVDSEMELPRWLDPSRGINFMQAVRIPGVIEFSLCSFFCGVTSYFFSYVFHCYNLDDLEKIPSVTAFYAMSFITGAITGGLIVGVLKDMFQKSALLCICILVISVPVIYLQLLFLNCTHGVFAVILHFVLGLFVEAPYILLKLSVSADLGTHRMIKRGVRGLSTVAGIVEGAALIGSSLAPIIYIHVVKFNYRNALLIMPAFQILAALCLLRMAIADYKKNIARVSLSDYLKTTPRSLSYV